MEMYSLGGWEHYGCENEYTKRENMFSGRRWQSGRVAEWQSGRKAETERK